MLYISQQLTRNKYLVMDTDDGVEEEVTSADLLDYTKRGLDIKGVTYEREGINYSFRVSVYTESNSICAKFRMMYGIEMSASNRVLKKFSISCENVKSCTIRLSDYFDSIDAFCFSSCYSKQDRNIIIILDDKLTINPKAFNSFYTNTVQFDFRELSNDKLVSKICTRVYETVLNSNLDCYYKRVIDNPFRRELNIMINILTSGKPTENRPTSLRGDEFLNYSQDVNNTLQKLYNNEFKALGSINDFYWSDSSEPRYYRSTDSSNKARISQVKRRLGIFNLGDTSLRNVNFLLKDDTMFKIASVVGQYTTVNKNSIKRLTNYIYYFKIHCNKVYMDYYIRFARNFLDWLYSEAQNT